MVLLGYLVLVAQARPKVVLNLKVVLLPLLCECLANVFLVLPGLVLDLLAGPGIYEFLQVLSALRNVVPRVEASVFASGRVRQVVVQIGSLRFLPSDCGQILITHF